MLRKLLRISRGTLCLLTALWLTNPGAVAQEFDPATINWEALSKIPMKDFFIKKFNKDCAVCHGEDLRGAPLGTPLVGMDLRHGDSVEQIANSIATGFPDKGMPAWEETLDADQIWNLALYVAEQRQGTTILDKRDDIPLEIPAQSITSEQYSFRIEKIAAGLDPMPFSIAPLPDGSILLSERMRGLRIISPTGEPSAYIIGTPPVYDDAGSFLGQVQGLGWMLDVAIHPDYADNGWIYIHHTDRCEDCNDLSRRGEQPVSMNRLIRGRIRDGAWIDEEVLWTADLEMYTNTSDLAAGGRIAFDDSGHVYFSVGMKAPLDWMGCQELDQPYGKIHRLNDDGSIPADNPFTEDADAIPSIWTYGHRSIQGLEFNPQTGDMWSSEMGPRGGDEINRLIRGRNYGWPVFTSGVNYDGRPVDGAKKLGSELDPAETEFPVVDMTPARAISSFIFYDAQEFPQWQGNIIVGTLRATDLLRMEVEDNQVVHTETLLTDLARFRDIETGSDGQLYILLEHKTGSQIIRLVPTNAVAAAP